MIKKDKHFSANRKQRLSLIFHTGSNLTEKGRANERKVGHQIFQGKSHLHTSACSRLNIEKKDWSTSKRPARGMRGKKGLENILGGRESVSGIIMRRARKEAFFKWRRRPSLLTLSQFLSLKICRLTNLHCNVVQIRRATDFKTPILRKNRSGAH